MSELPIQFSGDENHVHPRHTGHRPLDLILALSAIFISAVSLFIAVEHGRTERQLVAANSWPFLAVGIYVEPGGVSARMNNSGVGPAKLERFEVLFNGEAVPDLYTLLERCCGVPTDPAERQTKGLSRFARSSLADTVFRPGQELPVMSITRDPADTAMLDRLAGSLGSISFRGCYCSVFDECWTTRFVDLKPRPVASCSAGPSFNDAVSGGQTRPQPN